MLVCHMATLVSGIAIRSLTPALVGRAVDCVGRSFQRDPFTRALGLEPKDWAAMSGMFIERAAVNQPAISLVACMTTEAAAAAAAATV